MNFYERILGRELWDLEKGPVEGILSMLASNRNGPRVPEEIPLDDAATWQAMANSEIHGNQTPDTWEQIRRLEPTCIDDLAVFTALYRPKTVAAGLYEEFLRRKQNASWESSGVDWIDELLKPSYGIIAFQEDAERLRYRTPLLPNAYLKKGKSFWAAHVIYHQTFLQLDPAQMLLKRLADRRKDSD